MHFYFQFIFALLFSVADHRKFIFHLIYYLISTDIPSCEKIKGAKWQYPSLKLSHFYKKTDIIIENHIHEFEELYL